MQRDGNLVYYDANGFPKWAFSGDQGTTSGCPDSTSCFLEFVLPSACFWPYGAGKDCKGVKMCPPPAPPSPPSLPSPPSPPSLPSPPVYTLMNNALSWSDASAACLAAGQHLASVHSAAENALLLTAAAGNTVWIGGTDAACEGAWKWSPSGTPLSYTNWNGGEPNDYGGNEDCLRVSSWGSWNDRMCTDKLKYVCGSACGTLQPLQVSRSHCVNPQPSKRHALLLLFASLLSLVRLSPTPSGVHAVRGMR